MGSEYCEQRNRPLGHPVLEGSRRHPDEGLDGADGLSQEFVPFFFAYRVTLAAVRLPKKKGSRSRAPYALDAPICCGKPVWPWDGAKAKDDFLSVWPAGGKNADSRRINQTARVKHA
jgi:hypothetical protein